MDYSSVVGAVDLDAVATALGAIGALLMVPKVVKLGINKVLSMVGSDDPHAGGYWQKQEDGSWTAHNEDGSRDYETERSDTPF